MVIDDRVEINIEGGVADVRLQRPEKMNALDRRMFKAIAEAGRLLAEDSDVRVVVVSGEGRAFCAGLDTSSVTDSADKETEGASLNSLEPRTHGIANLFQCAAWVWRDLPVPVIAAVHGVAFGGGFQIALGADMRYVAPGTRFSVMEIKWGLVPDMAGTQLMKNLAREDIVRELSYTGRIFDAEQALQYGFVTELVDDPLAKALEVAAVIAGKNPEAIRANKRLYNLSHQLSAEEGLLMESVEQDKIMGTANQLEAVLAQIEGRAPTFNQTVT